LSAGATPRPTVGFFGKRWRILAALAVGLVVLFVAWLLLRGDDDSDRQARPSGAVAASVADLRAVARATGTDVYWAGTRRGFTYELTRTRGRNIYIRYLPPGAPVGVRRPDYLTVGSYPNRNAYRTVRRAARRRGARVTRLDGGGLAVANRARPESLYFASPGSRVLVEVYDPSPARARRLVTSGRVDPIRG
jgi:hypothetical protein